MEEITIEKINETEVKEIIPQQDLEIIHDLNEKIKERNTLIAQRDELNLVINDYDILIAKIKKAGCKETPINIINEDIIK